MNQMEEYLPVLNDSFDIIGKAPRSEFHGNQKTKLLHPVVHLHYLNMQNQIFLQLRPENKLIQPGKWDTAVGGHVSYGESIETALKRESMEEIGILPENLLSLGKYVWETEIERELVYIFLMRSSNKPKYNKEELADGKFWEISDINKNLDQDFFTPNFVHEFNIIKESQYFRE